MKAFVWKDDYNTGSPVIDEQHRHLVDLINRLAGALTVNQTVADAVVQAAFDGLIVYVREHFATEEDLMRAQRVDPRHLRPHVRSHEQFGEQVRAMWAARSTISNPSEVFLSFLTSWLCMHVLGVDQAMARQLDAIGAGATPAEAYRQEVERLPEKAGAASMTALRNTYRVVCALSTDLLAANRELEARVAARTAELREANEALQVANQKLEVYAQTDGLLGIANRRYFDARLVDEWKRAQRERQALGALMLDVDDFKAYNDHYGHLAGDDCLKAIAGAVAGRLQRPVDLLARYGGEEFVVLLPNTGPEGAQKVAQGLCEVVRALALPHAQSRVAAWVTVSIGVAVRTPNGTGDPNALVAEADEALYRAKQQGRDRVCLFS